MTHHAKGVRLLLCVALTQGGCSLGTEIFIEAGPTLQPQSISYLTQELRNNGNTVTVSDEPLQNPLMSSSGEYPFGTVVLRQPASPYSAEEIESAKRFLESGGRVVLFTSDETNLEGVLSLYGFSFGDRVESEDFYIDPANVIASSAGVLSGQWEEAVFESGRALLFDASNAEAVATSRGDGEPLAARVAIGEGELFVVSSLRAIADHDPNAQQAMSGFYLYDNCQMALSIIGGGDCSPDTTPPEILSLQIWDDYVDAYNTDFTQLNSEFYVHLESQDLRGVFSTSYRINGGPWQDMGVTPQPRRFDVSAPLFVRDLPVGESLLEVRVADRTGNASTASVTLTRQIFATSQGGRIELSGVEADGMGLSAFGVGHDVPDFLSSVFFNFDSGLCLPASAGPAFYAVASADKLLGDEAIAGAKAIGIQSGFVNTAAVMAGQPLEDITFHFEPLDLGDDQPGDITQGADWEVVGSQEKRVYSNPGDRDRDGVCEDQSQCSKVEIHFQGTPILVGTMGALYVGLEYNNPQQCFDDFSVGATPAIRDMAIAPDTPQTSLPLAEALLEDIGAVGVCFRIASPDPIVRTGSSIFSSQFGSMELGSCGI